MAHRHRGIYLYQLQPRYFTIPLMMNVCPAQNIRAALLFATLLAVGAPSIASHTSSPSKQEFDSVMQLKARAAHGEQLFDTCAACHGSKGIGAPDGTVPAIAGQHFRVIVWALVSFRQKQGVDPRMEHFASQHHLDGAQDIADVAAYVSHMPPPSPSSRGDSRQSARAATMYRRNCSSCHGINAQGDDRTRSPRLASQRYEYLLRQVHDGIDGQRSNFSAGHIQLLRSLEPAELTAICDYLSRVTPVP